MSTTPTRGLSVSGLEYIPDTPGEKRLTLRVKPMPGEQVATNNEVSTYLDVLKGGLKVLYIQGPDFSWEPHYLTPALDAAREIHVDYRLVREPARLRRRYTVDAAAAYRARVDLREGLTANDGYARYLAVAHHPRT